MVGKTTYIILMIILIISILWSFSNIYLLFSVLLLFGCTIPLLIYFNYGKNPDITYKAEYERDIPTNDSPAIVNAICGSGFSKTIGEPDMDGFQATIMDLINKKYLVFEKTSEIQSMNLEIDPTKDKTILKSYELDVLNFLLKFTGNNEEMDIDEYFMTEEECNQERKHKDENFISMNRISEDLSNPQTALIFRNTYHNWKNNIQKELSTDETLKKIYDKKGCTYLRIFGVIGLITAMILFIIAIFNLPKANILALSSVIFGLVAITSLILPQRVEGQWTTYGEEYNAKWHNFKKYIEDFSLIKEYPPESIKIWNKYLVYATALGVAQTVRKAMESYLPKESLQESDIYMFHYIGGYNIMSNALALGFETASIQSAGGDFVGSNDLGRGFGRFGGPL